MGGIPPRRSPRSYQYRRPPAPDPVTTCSDDFRNGPPETVSRNTASAVSAIDNNAMTSSSSDTSSMKNTVHTASFVRDNSLPDDYLEYTDKNRLDLAPSGYAASVNLSLNTSEIGLPKGFKTVSPDTIPSPPLYQHYNGSGSSSPPLPPPPPTPTTPTSAMSEEPFPSPPQDFTKFPLPPQNLIKYPSSPPIVQRVDSIKVFKEPMKPPADQVRSISDTAWTYQDQAMMSPRSLGLMQTPMHTPLKTSPSLPSTQLVDQGMSFQDPARPESAKSFVNFVKPSFKTSQDQSKPPQDPTAVDNRLVD